MAQSIHASNDAGLYSYEAGNTSAFDGVQSDAPEFSLLHSRAVWAFSIVVAFLIARIFTQKQKLPAGVKRLPKIPGKPYFASVGFARCLTAV